MLNEKLAVQFVLYRHANESYYRYYQNCDGTFCRITTDVRGHSTWINYFTLSQVASQVYDAALLGYRVVDLKGVNPSEVGHLHEEIKKGALKLEKN